MASGSNTSQQTDRGRVETATDFIFLDPKITADSDCSHKIKRCLLFGRKVMTNLGILKSRDITFPRKFRLVKAMVFPVVMYGCESWSIKKLSAKELMLSNCGAGEDSESPFHCKETKPVIPKGNQP